VNRSKLTVKAWLIAMGIAIGFMGISVVSSKVGAQGGYMLTWYTIDGGGGSSSGGGYTLRGTSGQTDTGNLSSRNYNLWGGFWRNPALNPSPTVTNTAAPTATGTATPTSTVTATASSTATSNPTDVLTTTPTNSPTATIEGLTPTITATDTGEDPNALRYTRRHRALAYRDNDPHPNDDPGPVADLPSVPAGSTPLTDISGSQGQDNNGRAKARPFVGSFISQRLGNSRQ
jgi:hypothetical protein